jgi:hypothetical protein
MRAVFSIVGLLVVVLLVSLLAKKQIASTVATPQGPASAAQVQQQFKQALDTALQTSGALPEDKP